DGREPSICPLAERVDAEGAALYESLGRNWNTDDADGNGIIDRWEALVAADVACDPSYNFNDRLRNKFTGNYSRLVHDAKLPQIWNWRYVVAMLGTANGELGTYLHSELGLTLGMQEFAVNEVTQLNATGDLDGDGYTNAQEAAYCSVLGMDY